MRRTVNIAIYLCLLLFVNEFGPAHFKRLHVHKLRKQLAKEDNGNSNVDKRSIASTFGKWAVKILTYGGKFLETTSSLASVVTTFLNLVTQCCYGKWSDTCVWTNEAKNIGQELDTKKQEIRDMVLETKNLESTIIMASEEFNYTVMEMHKIGKASDRLLRSLDRNISVQLNLTTARLEKLIQEKEAIGERVKFVNVETEYFNAVDGILGIAVPMVTTIIPAVPKLKLWMKARMGRYKSYELDHSVDAKVIEPPQKGSPRYQAGNSWFGKQASKIAFKLDKTKNALQTKYTKAVGIIKNFQKGFETVISFSKIALNIFAMYRQFTKCEDAYQKAKEAVENMRKARIDLNSVGEKVEQSRAQMREARDKLKQELASEIFINDLKELRETLSKLVPERTDEDFKGIIASIGQYIDGIEQQDPDLRNAFQLISELYQGLGQLSFYFGCYTKKTTILRTVVEKCKSGENTISVLNEDAQLRYDSDADICQNKIGIAQLTDDQLQTVVDKQAEKQNFNKKCMANNDAKRKETCNSYCEDTDVEDLPGEVGIDKDVVEIFMESCTPCKFSENTKKIACKLLSRNIEPSEIARDWLQRYTAKQIKELDCSK